jgi:hypothetical protein
MRTVELFSGTASFSKVARSCGFATFTVDINPDFTPDLVADVRFLKPSDFPYRPEILWVSPPCQGFSVAAIGKNWATDNIGLPFPKSDSAARAVNLVLHTKRIIRELRPLWFFIENPRGMLRKLPMMDEFIRHTVTYCQYGDTRQKPTDIWTNANWWKPRPPCSPGDKCHEAAPRGSRTGTQGLKNSTERGAIPPDLFREIFGQMPKMAWVADNGGAR